jgi:chitodextrinase
VRVTATSTTSISIAWDPSGDDVAVLGYGLYRNSVLLGSVGRTTLGVRYINLACGTTYTLGVDAFDGDGNRSATTSIEPRTAPCSGSDTTKPSAPSALSAQVQTGPKVALSWTGSSDNVGVAGYRIYRGDQQIGTSSTTTYTDSSVSAGSSYTYTVRGYDAAGNVSDPSNSAAVSIPGGGDTTSPSAPPSFGVTTFTRTDITVAWNASTDNVGVTRYGLYRNGVLLGTVGATVRSVRYINLTCGTTYTLAVDAADAAGNRSAQSTLSAKTANC